MEGRLLNWELKSSGCGRFLGRCSILASAEWHISDTLTKSVAPPVLSLVPQEWSTLFPWALPPCCCCWDSSNCSNWLLERETNWEEGESWGGCRGRTSLTPSCCVCMCVCMCSAVSHLFTTLFSRWWIQSISKITAHCNLVWCTTFPSARWLVQCGTPLLAIPGENHSNGAGMPPAFSCSEKTESYIKERLSLDSDYSGFWQGELSPPLCAGNQARFRLGLANQRAAFQTVDRKWKFSV